MTTRSIDWERLTDGRVHRVRLDQVPTSFHAMLRQTASDRRQIVWAQHDFLSAIGLDAHAAALAEQQISVGYELEQANPPTAFVQVAGRLPLPVVPVHRLLVGRSPEFENGVVVETAGRQDPDRVNFELAPCWWLPLVWDASAIADGQDSPGRAAAPWWEDYADWVMTATQSTIPENEGAGAGEQFLWLDGTDGPVLIQRAQILHRASGQRPDPFAIFDGWKERRRERSRQGRVPGSKNARPYVRKRKAATA